MLQTPLFSKSAHVLPIAYALYFLVLKARGKKLNQKRKQANKETYLSSSLGQKAEFCGDIRVNFKDTLVKQEVRNGRNSVSFGDGKFQKVERLRWKENWRSSVS